jgi:MSHA biogenesis protein MshG
MSVFRYRARNTAGELEEGQREAASADALAEQLAAAGLIPVEIRLSASARPASSAIKFSLPQRGPDAAEISLFARQMYALTRAGVPILRCLDQLADTARNPHLAQALRDISSDLESGRELAGAMARHPRIFSPLFINMIRVGEQSGRLDEAFLRMYEYLESDRETAKQIKAALRYPSFVVIAMVAALFILMVYVVPVFVGLFDRFDMELPLPTRILIAVSNFMVAWWWAIVLSLSAAVGGFLIFVRTVRGRWHWDRLRLHFPLVGHIILRASLGRFARAFAMALRSGVPLIQALNAVSKAVDNTFLEQQALNMREGIARGESITRTAAATGVFTPLVLQMLAVGDETGQVDDMMQEVAEFYQSEVDYDVRRIGEIIQPLVIVVMGILVLILALGVFLPMWDMTRIAGR